MSLDGARGLVTPSRGPGPVRKTQTAAGQRPAVRAPAGTPPLGTTPQGFLAEVDGTTWNWVQLAANARSDGTEQRLRFDGVSDPLRQALQTNELFLVITDPAQIAGFEHVISIVDWPFKIDVGVGGDPVRGEFRNVLIFKFGTGSVVDRVRDGDVGGPRLHRDPSPCSSGSTSIQNAIDRKDTTPRLAPFIERMTSESWRGVIALAVKRRARPVSGRSQGPARRHRSVAVPGAPLRHRRQPRSTGGPADDAGHVATGLIDYVDKDLPAVSPRPSALADPTAPLVIRGDFRVLTLLIVSTTRRSSDFGSRIVVAITHLFGEDARRSDKQPIPIPENTVELNGR